MKLGDVVFFFKNSPEFKEHNNASPMASARVVAAWGGGETSLNLKVDRDSNLSALDNYSSVIRATSLDQALSTGHFWAKKEDVEAWGINLSDYFSLSNAVADYEVRIRSKTKKLPDGAPNSDKEPEADV